MKAIALVALLALTACVPLQPNPDQTPEQRLQGACDSFYDTLEAALVHDLSDPTLVKMQYAEHTVDPYCELDGPLTAGVTTGQALAIVEGFLAQAVLAEQEGSK